MRTLIPLSLLVIVLEVYAANFPFQARTVSRRTTITGQTVGNGSVPIANNQNAEYIGNITLGGQTIPVLLDTGSSDLWVNANVPGTQDTGKSVQLSYAVGTAKGDINTATLTFDDYTVENQAYLLVTDTSSFSTNIQEQGYSGLMGLGPNSGSVIYKTIDSDSDSGDAVIDRIFQQNKTSDNYITLLLNRASDPGEHITGQITISELVNGYESVTSQPKLTVNRVNDLTAEDQHWQVLTDDPGIIGPDGQPIVVSSIVPSAPDGHLIAVFDSGFTFPQVPRSVSDAIYGRVQGAEYNTVMQVWTIPCGQLLNISFNFGNVSYPVHPLDTSSSDFNVTNSAGQPACVGTFQPISSAFSILGEYDMIMGMGFLRNTYTLLDYGDFVSDTSNDRGDPFVQLLSITNVTAAHADFVQARLGGVDTTGASQYALLPASQEQHSPETAAEKKAALEEKVLSRWPEIFVGALALVSILVGLCIWRCCCRRGQKGVKGFRRNKGPTTIAAGNKRTSYKPLGEPAPPMHMQPLGYQDPYRVEHA